MAPAPREVHRGSTATTVYRALREDIVSLRRKPGDPIVEKQLAETFGVSRTPVREAVLKLADEGLVEIFPQSGTFVSRIPLPALPEAGLIRRSLEGTVVRLAAERASRSQIAQLRTHLAKQLEADAAHDLDGFHQADEAFHATIAEIAGAPGVWTVVRAVKVQVDRCRRLTLPVAGHIAKAIAEHEAIVDAIAAHDPERAARAVSDHLDGLELTIDDIRHATPLYFSRTLTNREWSTA
ncbi:GntR family transcriptional regulator [Azospirillum sp. ST 5-10]|uniref:GntR family transcriptional regulator n=1 Tax=unclassified Azospirillum TaxID=2630922 RepID=UPI003F49BC3E